jgi:DNA-directed RNA polymerase subunit H (RpoH/RPB5)
MAFSISSSRLLSIYNSRKTVLELLERQGFAVADYEGFSVVEVDAMFKNSQLDMLVENPTTKRKTYVKYYCSPKQTVRQIRPQTLDEIVEDLFVQDTVLEKADTLMVIIEEEPNDSIVRRMTYLHDREGVFVVMHNIKRLQVNILEHSMVPHMQAMSDAEVEWLKETYHVSDGSQLPEISRFDAQALAIALRPGQICRIQRNSPTAMTNEYYRVCV